MGQENKTVVESDPSATIRKQDHIELAFRSQVEMKDIDGRFLYEPLLSAHPSKDIDLTSNFLGKTLKYPVWISSMTGGTEWAYTINRNLARVCKDFGFGMGLGSCRSLLYSDEHFEDFNVRNILGDDRPLYANLGIAQIEQTAAKKDWGKITTMINQLQADGLIIHINPFQEWLQPEGDQIQITPIDTIKRALDALNVPIIVKEVGQGMGPMSIRSLLELPIAALDFGASGGTNFSLLELLRSQPIEKEAFSPLIRVGHSATDMTAMVNEIIVALGGNLKCNQIIASGGIKNFLDGYYILEKIKIPSIYGQASSFLRYAQGNYEDLYNFVEAQMRGLELATCYLRIRE